jgi:hypothetical protein
MGQGTVAQGGASGDEVTARMAFRIDWQGMDARRLSCRADRHPSSVQ